MPLSTLDHESIASVLVTLDAEGAKASLNPDVSLFWREWAVYVRDVREGGSVVAYPRPQRPRVRLTQDDRESIAIVRTVLDAERAKPLTSPDTLWSIIACDTSHVVEECEAWEVFEDTPPSEFTFPAYAEFTFPEYVASCLRESFETDAVMSGDVAKPDSYAAWCRRAIGAYEGHGAWTLSIPCQFLAAVDEYIYYDLQGAWDRRERAAFLRLQAQVNEAMADAKIAA